VSAALPFASNPEVRPNPSLNRARNGIPRLAVISFSASHVTHAACRLA